ncbi:MAG: BrnT family toxin [Pseudomonadota bacterium]
MEIHFDPVKDAKNRAERGLAFSRVIDLDWDTAIVAEDKRQAYPERRFVAAATLEGRLHIACFTLIEDGIRVISFRKANSREVKAYGQRIANR